MDGSFIYKISVAKYKGSNWSTIPSLSYIAIFETVINTFHVCGTQERDLRHLTWHNNITVRSDAARLFQNTQAIVVSLYKVNGRADDQSLYMTWLCYFHFNRNETTCLMARAAIAEIE